MKTVLFENINGYEIVKGFDVPQIDPIGTLKAIEPLLKETEEYKFLISKIEKINEISIAARDACKLAKLAVMQKNENEYNKKNKEYKDCLVKIEAIKIELKEFAPKLKAIELKLKKENPVYFTPSGCEWIIADDECDNLMNIEIDNNHRVCTDGKVIPDYTGLTLWQKKDKWQKIQLKLGEEKTSDMIIEYELTDEQHSEIETQFEKERIEKLNDDEKLKEMEELLKALPAKASQLRFELNLVNDPLADSKATEFYNKEKQRIESLYL